MGEIVNEKMKESEQMRRHNSQNRQCLYIFCDFPFPFTLSPKLYKLETLPQLNMHVPFIRQL